MTALPTVRVEQGSLTDGRETVLVNASNTELDLGSGVSNAIRQACGDGYQAHIHRERDRRRGGSLEPGEVLITDAGTHPHARFVAHAAVMDYRGVGGDPMPDLERLDACYRNLFDAIEELDEDSLSVAMVALGAGTGRLGARASMECAGAALRRHCESRDNSRISEIVFYGFELPEYLVMVEIAIRDLAIGDETLSDEVRDYVRKLL